MNYKEMMGFSRKPIKKESKKIKPRPTVTDMLKEEFGERLNEGPAYEYSRDITNIDKASKLMTKSVKGLEKTLAKKGIKNKKILGMWMSYFKKFEKDLDDIMRELL